MKIRVLKSEKGIALVAVVIFTVIITILGFSLLRMVNSEIVLAQNSVDKTRAFYLAEAGVELLIANFDNGVFESIGETALGEGSYRVDFHSTANPAYAIATGTVEGQVKRIKITPSFLAPPYECGIYAGGLDSNGWTLILRGAGDPCLKYSGGNEVGNYNGRDTIYGDIFVDGNVAMYQESSVRAQPFPNDYDINGDVGATGDVNRYDVTATIQGDVNEGMDPYDPPDLVGMNYAVNNTHNVRQIFDACGITEGPLPGGNALRNVFQINPGNMDDECDTTDGNDYFLTRVSGFTGGEWDTAPTPLDLGTNRIYYVDGDVWIHSKSTYGFTLSGKATIVATGNIHLCDNFVYANSSSMLGLVALGRYNDDGELVGGNVYFGDPTTGTLYTASAMMFAANNFLYNSMAVGSFSGEPESGFIINGNISALNQVSIERDWYTRSGSERRPARYKPTTGKWYDSGTGVELTPTQVGTMKHYQMTINYDERVRTPGTQPPGLPRGIGIIFSELTHWEELP
jgi:hypothetical protein